MTATRPQRGPGSGWAMAATRRALRTIRYVHEELVRAHEAMARPLGALRRRPQDGSAADRASANAAGAPADSGQRTTATAESTKPAA